MFYLLSTFWFIRTTKSILFWLYLWQLKEYHLGRFLDHFRTENGKNLIVNKLIAFKLFLVFLSLIVQFWLFIPDNVLDFLLIFSLYSLIILYFFESLKTLIDILKERIKKPIITSKTLVLILAGLTIEILFLYHLFLGNPPNFLALILAFDILTPIIVSAIVLFFQPLSVFRRNQIIRKAKKKREEFKDLLVIGITGSYGKTSTKEFLATILSEKFHPVKSAEGGAKQFNRVNVLKTKLHQNSEVGISQCILQDLKSEHEIFVCEMGAYNKGGIKLLCDISKPKIGILTGINEQHMATFGSQENIIKTKFELIESLPEDGVAFFNAKNKYCLELYQKTKIKKYLYGREAKFFGQENLLGAVAVAKELGMTEQEISLACQKIENKLPGIQIKKGVNDLTVLDATYSANPDGVIGHLEYLKTFPNKKVIIMPCLIELGKATIEVHKRIGKKIGEVCDLAIITTKECFENIKIGVNLQRVAPCKILFIENPKEILEKIKIFCQKEDVILLESRVPAELMKKLIL